MGVFTLSKNPLWNNVPIQDLVRDFFARKPKDVDGVMNTSAYYYRLYLLKKLFGRFAFENLPEGWDHDYILEVLFMNGFLVVCDTEAGVLPLKCGLSGINVFEKPTTAIIANPVLGNFERTIDVDCVVLQLQPNYEGVYAVINRYATMLAMCDSSIAVNLMNTKSTFIFGATSKAQSETLKKMYDSLACGEPAVFMKDGLNQEDFFVIPAKQNFIADDVQILKRKIINEFLTEIGINNTNNDKRERLTDNEVEANDQEVVANIQCWIDNITWGIQKINRMFGLNITFVIRDFGGKEKEGDQNESSEPS